MRWAPSRHHVMRALILVASFLPNSPAGIPSQRQATQAILFLDPPRCSSSPPVKARLGVVPARWRVSYAVVPNCGLWGLVSGLCSCGAIIGVWILSTSFRDQRPAPLRRFATLLAHFTLQRLVGRRARLLRPLLPSRHIVLATASSPSNTYIGQYENGYSYIAVVTPSPASTLLHSPNPDTISVFERRHAMAVWRGISKFSIMDRQWRGLVGTSFVLIVIAISGSSHLRVAIVLVLPTSLSLSSLFTAHADRLPLRLQHRSEMLQIARAGSLNVVVV
ncbi:hypothetical protein DFH09DRAFT_1341986 [Mycena vulgaris]|nr:hypothetical protein DFH09DRAFT_1341986 [Mycena vulgaris]